MKLVFLEQESRMGGVEYTTLRMAQALNKTKFETVIFCPEEGDLPTLARRAGITVEIVPRPRFFSVSLLWRDRYIFNPFGFVLTALSALRAIRALRRSLQSKAVDVLVTKGLLAHFYGGIAARSLRIPCIWYMQEEVDAKRAGGLFRKLLQICAASLPVKVIVDAQALLEQFGSTVKPQVIYNGVDADAFSPASASERNAARAFFALPEDALVIGQVARIIPLKGQAILLQAFASLLKEFPNIYCLFVGAPLFGSENYQQQLHEQAQQWGIVEKIRFSGFVPDVRQGLAAMDIFVHASIETDSPVSVLEAMACGLPMAVSAVRGTVEMISPNADAILFPPADSTALAAALASLLRDPSRRDALGEQARKSALEKFSLQASAAAFEALLETVHAS